MPIVPIVIGYYPAPVWRSHVAITISSPLYAADDQQGTDKQTAQALTKALAASLLQGLTE